MKNYPPTKVWKSQKSQKQQLEKELEDMIREFLEEDKKLSKEELDEILESQF